MNFNLKAQAHEVADRILEYKWLESEKRGEDIGLRCASDEWISNYYEDWFEFNRQRFIGA